MLDDPEEDAVVLKQRRHPYAPDFVANAGGLIHLAGLHLGMTLDELGRKIDEIEATTTEVLTSGESMESTYAAAIALAKKSNRRRANTAKEQVHAG